MEQHKKIGGGDWIMFTALSVVWGFSFYFIKKGLEVFHPVQVAAFRMSIAFLSLVPLIIWNYKKLNIPASKWKFIPLLGLFGNLIPAILFCTAETKIDSGLTGIMNGTTPLFALLFGSLFFRVPLTQNKIIGVAVGFIGALIIVLSKQTSITEINIYILMPLVATICYGINANIFKANFQDENPIVLALLQYTFVAPFALAYLYFTGAFHQMIQQPVICWHSLKYLLLLGILGTAYAQVIFNILTQRTSALFATMTTYLIPLVSIIVGLLDNEKILPIHFGGLMIILIGVYVGSRN
ncbi:MAG: putative permease, superfamily [Bacteroidota bacterium]|nr:putative permease, superfamily [Bacteroidota bacterium]